MEVPLSLFPTEKRRVPPALSNRGSSTAMWASAEVSCAGNPSQKNPSRHETKRIEQTLRVKKQSYAASDLIRLSAKLQAISPKSTFPIGEGYGEGYGEGTWQFLYQRSHTPQVKNLLPLIMEAAHSSPIPHASSASAAQLPATFSVWAARWVPASTAWERGSPRISAATAAEKKASPAPVVSTTSTGSGGQ